MRYLREISKYIAKLEETQRDNINAAAGMMADAIKGRKQIFSFGASHSFIVTMEMVYRTGGLMLVNPIVPHGMNLDVRPMTMTSRIERIEGYGRVLLEGAPAKAGDVIIIVSTSGRNSVALDMAIAAREKGLGIIGITSMDYTLAVTSRHSSGRKLYELCDIVIDNCAPYGDACVEVRLANGDLESKAGPVSSVTGTAIANQLAVSVCDILRGEGVDAPVFVSANTDIGDSYNKKLLEANKDRIHYM